ncbi:MAG: ribulokinase [Spirochaetes bacterium]|nr:ribulokinase [Spirochaetota bacterium]MBN2769456.1 ribulokinase [Spirochaetota bacterium]
MKDQYVIGIDYGTDSVRAVLINAHDGSFAAESVFYYPRWKEGLYCDAVNNRFRQHPLDYQEGLVSVVRGVLSEAGSAIAGSVKAIAVDTTGSTPCAVNRDGLPLALMPEFVEDPDAMFILWKDHTAIEEANLITKTARNSKERDYTAFVGGIYSSEWFWAKMLHVLRNNSKVRDAAFSWVEHCDWIPALLTGKSDPQNMYRSRCAAGHKAMWHEEFDGLPSDEFLKEIDPLLAGVRDRLFKKTETAEKAVGTLCPEWAEKLGLPDDVIVAGSAFDAHMGAAGGEIAPFDMVKVIGTSTCDIIVAPRESVGLKPVKGICGQVDGSVLPGMVGLEAGQSAFGDVYAWFRDILMWPVQKYVIDAELVHSIENKMLYDLEEEAAKLEIDPSVVSVDWFNGRRTPDANQKLKGILSGLNLGTTAPRIYRSLIESTAFGARAILDRFLSEGIDVRRVIAIGGVARKSKLGMQILADIMNREIFVSASDQAVALGTAMFAAVAAGIYPDLEKAQNAIGAGFSMTFSPRAQTRDTYEQMYQKYKELGDFAEKNLYGE